MTNLMRRDSDRTYLKPKILDILGQQMVVPDPKQQELIELLDHVLNNSKSSGQPGIYIYGPPGRGKTVIINALVAVLPVESTARFHFHEFFHRLNSPAHREPGQRLGAIFAQGLERELAGLDLLVFDEFHCTEPGDAMLMAKLVKYCAEHQIHLITTSNYCPEKLLDDDAFHHLVQPIIDRIHEEFAVFELDHDVDYRLLASDPLAPVEGYRNGTLNVTPLPQLVKAQDTMVQIGYDEIGPAHVDAEEIWISFDQICRTRRNTADYLELSERYTRWYVLDIPSSATMPMDEERRLANLIDIFYDKNIEIHLYAEDDLSHLGHMLHDTEKARLTSRLAQLQLFENERIDIS